MTKDKIPPAKEPPNRNATRSALHAKLEQARADFHHLLSAIPEHAWNEKGAGTEWRVREEMWHITWGMAFMLTLIRNARRRIGLPRPPMRIADRLNVLYSRLRAGRATHRSIAGRYDRTHTAVLAPIDTIRDEEWGISATVFGEAHTIAELFAGIPHHLEEHAARVRPWLDLP